MVSGPGRGGLPARVGGAALASATRAVAGVRRAAKPLHPRGDLVTGTLRRTGAVPGTGVPWFDDEATDEVLVRRSRAVGWPAALPDVLGLAVRVPVGDRHADVLLASTGLGRLTRHLLAPGWGSHRSLTTLLPYVSPSGSVLIAAVPVDDTCYDLFVAVGGGQWRGFGDLELAASRGPDPTVSFDPVLHPLPGLEFPEWVTRLREPAYRAARRTRGDHGTPD